MKPYYQEAGITIYCGDCLDVLRTLPVESVDAVVCDPPYGIDYQSAWRTDKAKRKGRITNDKAPFIWWIYDAARIMRSPGAMLCFCRWDISRHFHDAIDTAGLCIRSEVIWDRKSHGMGDLIASFAPQHDTIWFATKGEFRFFGERPKSVVSYQRLGGDELEHPNEKPEGLLRCLLRPVVKRGGLVIDPFMGSGATIFAAKQLGMNAVGIEIEERYCEIAAKRLAQGVLELEPVA